MEKDIRVNVSSMASPMIFFPETADGPPVESACDFAGPSTGSTSTGTSWTCTPGGDFTFRSYEYSLRMFPIAPPVRTLDLDLRTLGRRCLEALVLDRGCRNVSLRTTSGTRRGNVVQFWTSPHRPPIGWR